MQETKTVIPKLKFSEIPIRDFGNSLQVSGVIYSGRGRDYLIPLPGESNLENIEILEASMGDWKELLKQSDFMETEVLAKAKDGSFTKAVIRKSNRQIEQRISWQVYKRDSYACRYCGKSDVALTVDHAVLWEDAGPSIPENLVTACRVCNRERSNTKYPEWLKSKYYQQVSKHLPSHVKLTNEELVHQLDKIPLKYHISSR